MNDKGLQSADLLNNRAEDLAGFEMEFEMRDNVKDISVKM